MRLYNVEYSAQKDIVNDAPVMDNTTFNERRTEEEKMEWTTKKAGKKNFDSLFIK